MSDIQNLTTTVQNHGESSYKRRDAFTKLTRLNPPDLINILTPAITADGDRYLNQDIVKHLASLKSSDCFEALEKALAVDDPYVKTYAIQGLGDIGDLRAVERLRPFLDDRSYSIKTVAEQAIEKLGGLHPAPPELEENPDDQKEEPEEERVPTVPETQEPVTEELLEEKEEEEEPAEDVPEVKPETGSTATVEVPSAVPVEPEPVPEPEPKPVVKEAIEGELLESDSKEIEASLVSSSLTPANEVDTPVDKTSVRRFFGEHWEKVKPIYVEYREVAAGIPEQEARSLQDAQGLQSFHADKDDDIAELDKRIEELKGQLGRQDISIDNLNNKIADIHQQLASPLISVADMFFRKKETLTLELNNFKHMRERLTKSAASNKKELKELLASRKKLTARMDALEKQHDRVSGTLKTMLDRLEAIDRQLDECYEAVIFSVPKQEIRHRLESICGSGDKLSFLEYCLDELIHELQGLNRNKACLEQCRADLSEEQRHCLSTTDALASEVGSGFQLKNDNVRLEFNIYGQLNFEEKSTFWSGFSNAEGTASGTGTARTEFPVQKVSWSLPEGLDGSVKDFAESWQNLGAETAQTELIHSMVIAGQHTVREYIRLIRNQVESGNQG